MIIGPRDHSPQRSASPLVLCRTSKAARIFKFSNIFENSKSLIFLNITAQVSSLKISWCCRVQLKSQKATQPKFTPSLLHTYLRQDVEGASQPQPPGNHLNAIAHQPCFFLWSHGGWWSIFSSTVIEALSSHCTSHCASCTLETWIRQNMSPVRWYHLRRCTSALPSLLHRDNTEVEYTGRRHHTIFVKISDLHCRYARFLLLGWLVDQQQPSLIVWVSWKAQNHTSYISSSCPYGH